MVSEYAELQGLCNGKTHGGGDPGELGLSSVINLLHDAEQSSFFPGAQFSCCGNEETISFNTAKEKRNRSG